MSVAQTQRSNTPGDRAARSAALTPAMRRKISRTLMGRKAAPETRAKISAAGIGKHPSQETRAKISAARSAPLGSRHGTGNYVETKTENGWQHEHRVVMGLQPGDGKIVHHRDGDPANNDPRNLRVFESQAAHLSHHAQERARERR